MDKIDVSQPIQTVLEGSNYTFWAQAMCSFLKGRKLWRYTTGDITQPTKLNGETEEKFVERLEDWDSKNHQIITWFHNTSSASINHQFGRFDTAQAVWDFLKKRYTTIDLAHRYQLLSTLHRMRQEPGQSINSFLSQIQFIWDRSWATNPRGTTTPVTNLYIHHYTLAFHQKAKEKKID